MIASVNRIFLRRSGTLNALTKALSTVARFYRSGDDLGGASGAPDLAPRGLGEGRRAHRRLAQKPATPGDLGGPALAAGAGLKHGSRVRLAVRERLRQPLYVH